MCAVAYVYIYIFHVLEYGHVLSALVNMAWSTTTSIYCIHNFFSFLHFKHCCVQLHDSYKTRKMHVFVLDFM